MNSEFKAKIIDNFLSKDECDFLLNFAKQSDLWRSIPNNIWDNRLISLNEKLPDNIRTIFNNICIKMQQILQFQYNLDKSIYPDTIDLVRWFEGMSQHPHCDDMSDSSTESPKFNHRYFGCIIYLNEDYEGGRTIYPEHNYEVTPKSGRLAIHLGDCNHRHGVSPVKGNTRYTIGSFWTFDKTRSVFTM